MALTLGTNCGFVTTAPTSDPTGIGLAGADTKSNGILHTSPGTAIRITEIGWWCQNATEEADFEVGIYTDAGNNEPETLVGKSSPEAKGTGLGWKVVTGLNIVISSSTAYWIAQQLDDTASGTLIDFSGSGGNGTAQLNSQTSLPSDWGTSSITDTDGKIAIYAVWSDTEASSSATDNMTIIGENVY